MDMPNGTSSSISVPDLPEDIFLLILDSLEAWDIVRCQKVSRKWHHAFTEREYLRQMLKKYSKVREIRSAPDLNHDDHNQDWNNIFNTIACRYYHLTHGKVHTIRKYKLAAADQHGNWFPVGQWDYHESQPGGRLYHENAATHLSRLGNKPYLFRASLWSYDDGLVAGAFIRNNIDLTSRDDKLQILSVLSISTSTLHTVPFNITDKIIRNITLRSHTLVVEWSELNPYHDLNDAEKVHRHFATCFDIHPSTHAVTLRNEWKMHFLGLPLNTRDRFFSTHDGTHYAIYIWQPHRSMYTGDEDRPIEAIFVWDISKPSSYLPSLDPTGSFLPPEGKRPHMVSRFTFHDLDFLGVRQQGYIRLLSMHIDSESSTLTIKENVRVVGQGYFDPAERLMCATSTTFPFVGLGCARRMQYHEELPPYRGHCSMETDEVEEPEKWFTNIMDVCDREADLRFSLIETCFTGSNVQNGLMVRVKVGDDIVAMEDDVTREIGVLGKIAGDERWIVGQNGSMEIVVATF